MEASGGTDRVGTAGGLNRSDRGGDLGVPTQRAACHVCFDEKRTSSIQRDVTGVRWT